MDDDEQLVKGLLDHVQALDGAWVPFQVDDPDAFGQLARWIFNGTDSPHRSQYGARKNAFAIEWYDPGEGWGSSVAHREVSGGKGRIKYRPPRFRPERETP